MIQDTFKELAENCCLFCCYIKFALLQQERDLDYSFYLSEMAYALKTSWIDTDCFVKEPDKIIKHAGGHGTVIRSNPVVDESFKYRIACFTYRDNQHFVIVNDKNQVIFNPLNKSECVDKGTITSYRDII